MATAKEQEAGRSKRKTYYERTYFVTDASSIDDAETEALTEAPSAIGDFNKRTVESTEGIVGNDSVAVFEVVISFHKYINGEREPKESTEPTRISYSTTNRTKLIKATDTYSFYPAGASTPQFDGAIGVNGDIIEGVEVPDPGEVYTETHYVSSASALSVFSTLRGLKGKKNSGTFRGLAAGSVLFLGWSASLQANGVYSMDLNFEIEENKTGITIGSVSGIAKDGFDYLWVYFEKEVDEDSGIIIQKPKSVYVHKDAIESASFASIPSIVT